MEEKKIGLPSVVATGVGVIVATSCLLSLGQGAGGIGVTFIISMIIACFLNCLLAFSVSELNALMPNLTGGLPQYTLACMGPFATIVIMIGGYLFANTVVGGVECAMFGNAIIDFFGITDISGSVFCILLLITLITINLFGVDIFAKVQNVVAYGLIGSLVIMGVLGCLKMGSGEAIEQPAVVSSAPSDIISMCGLAFFLFIACEYIVPISKQVKNPRRNVPLGMILSLLVILIMQTILVIGFYHYTPWEELGSSASPHLLYGEYLMGSIGKGWMTLVSILAVVSTANSIIASLSFILTGMAKINLLPTFFAKTNKKGAPYWSVLTIGGIMLVINATGLSTSDKLSFMILAASVFIMIAYIATHINVLILRKRLPKAPRTFKVPFGALLPIMGILGTAWMIWNIAADMSLRLSIYKMVLVIFAVIAVYGIVWVKGVRKLSLFKAIPLEKVMAMENEKYFEYH